MLTKNNLKKVIDSLQDTYSKMKDDDIYDFNSLNNNYITNKSDILNDILENTDNRFFTCILHCTTTLADNCTKKLSFVKAVKELTGLGLKDAKEAVDNMFNATSLSLNFICRFSNIKEFKDYLINEDLHNEVTIIIQ